jgi:hypothetical protein
MMRAHPSPQGGTPSGAIRSGEWKLIEFFDDGRLELYHLSQDLGEQNNLAQVMPDKAKELHDKLVAWRKAVGISRIYLWLPRLFLIMGLGVVDCAHRPPLDKNGNQPDDVVRNFLKLVQAAEYESAQRLWYGESKRVGDPSDPRDPKIDLRMNFEDFCAQYRHIDLGSAKISKAYRGKSGFSMITVDWQEDGMKKHDQFGLKIIEGEWKMERGYYW